VAEESTTPDWATLRAVSEQHERGSFAGAVGNGIKTPRIDMWVTGYDDRVIVKLTGLLGRKGMWASNHVYDMVVDLGKYLKELAELTTAQPQIEETAAPRVNRTKSDTECWTMNFVLLGPLSKNIEFARALRRIPSDWRESLDG
jgi:hypothetical protein